jgi:hypothetical protein
MLAGFVLLQPALAHAAGDVPALIKSIATDLCGTFAAVCVTIGLVGAGAQFFSSGGDMHSIPRILIPWAIAAAIALGATAYVGTLGYGS